MSDTVPATGRERWRLVLGKYAEKQCPSGAATRRMDEVLEALYGREYAGRGTRSRDPEDGRGADLSETPFDVPTWLGELRELFPRDVAEIVERHALERYGLTRLVTDPATLASLEPNQDLLKTLLKLRGHLGENVLGLVRDIVRSVVADIERRLRDRVRHALAGRLNRFRHAPIAVARNFDALGTLRANLKHYDRERGAVIVERLKFFERNTRKLPWDVILCVDESGSMADSVIHSAVMAAILAGVPSLRVKLVVFDTNVVDLSGYVDDPVEILMSVRLGGGTDIGKALHYCEQLVEYPPRTIVALVTDFIEGPDPARLYAVTRRLAEARVKLLGLASLDDAGGGVAFDRGMAERLAACGMEVAALTPQRFAEWLVAVIS